jgi:hypothetical protein
MSTDKSQTPAARVMEEAIELAIEERSPYPERAAFVDADEPYAGVEIRRAAYEGRAVVLVSADGSTRTLPAELALQAHGERATGVGAIEEHSIVKLRERIGNWPAGTVGTVVSDYGDAVLVEIADEKGVAQDFLRVSVVRLDIER